MKKVLLLLLALSLAAYGTACSKEVKATNLPEDTKLEARQSIDAYGTVKASNLLNITLDLPASIEKLYIKEGQKVKAGEPLIALDLSEFTSQIGTSSLELRAEQNEMQRLKGKYAENSGSPDMGKLLNDKKSTEDLYNKAKDDLAAKELLYKSGSISKSELDEIIKSVDAKKKNVDDINYSINSMKFSGRAEMDSKILKIASLESELKLMKNKLAKPYMAGSNIISSVKNAVACEIGYQPGDIVSPQKKLLSLIDLDSLMVEANVSEEFIKDVKPGAAVTIIPVADKTREYKGRIAYISDKAIQQNNETFVQVGISIDNMDSFLLPEFNVDVKIEK